MIEIEIKLRGLPYRARVRLQADFRLRWIACSPRRSWQTIEKMGRVRVPSAPHVAGANVRQEALIAAPRMAERFRFARRGLGEKEALVAAVRIGGGAIR